MFDIVRWFTGVVLIQFRLKVIIEVKAVCIVSTRHGLSCAECIEDGLTSIPRDCDKGLQVLNVSRNRIVELKDDDLANYPLLMEFTITGNNVIVKISANFFDPVAESLQRIDISFSCFSSPFAKLPANTKRVVANSLYKTCDKIATLPALDQLEFLSEIEYRENNLDDFPKLHPRAQIQYVDLSKNPLKNLKYSDIAPYCVLTQLNLFGTEIGLVPYRDQCCALKKWGERSNTSINLQCSSGGSSCPNVEFDANSISAYEECIRNPGASFLSTDYYLMNIVIVMAILLSFSYLAYRYYVSDAMRRYQEKKILRTAQSEQEEENEVSDN